MLKSIIGVLIFLCFNSASAVVIPSSGYAKNVLNCMFPGSFSILYYVDNGMITYTDQNTINIIGDVGEEVISLYGSVKSFGPPASATKDFVVLDGNYNEVLRVFFISTGFNVLDNTIVNHYNAIYKGQSGQCILLQEGPRISPEFESPITD